MIVSAKDQNDSYVLTLKGREAHFDNPNIENRWDIEAAFDTTFELTDTQSLKLGTSFLRDFFSLDRANITRSYAEYALRTDDYRLRLQSKSHVERNLERRGSR